MSSVKGCGIGCLALIPLSFLCFIAASLGITLGSCEVQGDIALMCGVLALVLLVMSCVGYRNAFKTQEKKQEKKWTRAGHLFAVFTISCELFAFFFFCGASDFGKTDSTPVDGWSAENIELPHLDNGTRYTSNPDQLLQPETVEAVDSIMSLMDSNLGIEGAVVVVSRTKNADIFRFCQDLFDLYGIGKDDRGLVIAVALDDREARIHTGSALEADFTDIETNRLQNNYLLPLIKEGHTDEGVRQLTDACYRYLSGKDMPVVQLDLSPVETPNQKANTLMLVFAVVITVSLFIIYVAWQNYCVYKSISGFSSSSHGSSSSSSSRSYSSSSSGSSRSSGGYSGGHSRGGGSTVRW